MRKPIQKQHLKTTTYNKHMKTTKTIQQSTANTAN